MMKPQAQMKNIHLHLLQNDELLAVYANRAKLKQVLIDLLSNAIKNAPTGGQVTIEWKKNIPDRARVSILDTGMGVPAEEIDRLLQPYGHLRQEDDREEETGIGLTVAKKLVEMMGGTIGVTSTEGAGSTFWIELLAA